MLSEAQRNNIYKLDSETVIEIMHECAERLGIVSVDEYCKIMGESKRTTYQKIKDNRIPVFKISDYKFPIINK